MPSPNDELKQLSEVRKSLNDLVNSMAEMTNLKKAGQSTLLEFDKMWDLKDFRDHMNKAKRMRIEETTILKNMNDEMKKAYNSSKDFGKSIADFEQNMKNIYFNKDFKNIDNNLTITSKNLKIIPDNVNFELPGYGNVDVSEIVNINPFAMGLASNTTGEMARSAGMSAILDNIVENEFDPKKIFNLQNLKDFIKDGGEVVVSALNVMMKNGYSSFMEMNDKLIGETRNLNRNLGISGERSDVLRKNIVATSGMVGQLNLDWTDLVKIQQNYTDVLGNSNILTNQELFSISKIAQGIGLSVDEAAKLTANFRLYGLQTSLAEKNIQNLVDLSDKYGLNSKKTIQNLSANLDKLQKVNFKDGVDGMMRMVAQSENLKMNMNDAVNLAESVWGLDKAVELAANLQLLGGAFAEADAFELHFLARNDVEGFQKKLNNMLMTLGQFNKKTGEVVFDATDRDFMKIYAEQTKTSVDNVMKSVIAQKNLKQIMSENSKLTEEQAQKLANIGKFQDGKFQVQIQGGVFKDVGELLQSDLDKLEKTKVDLLDRGLDSQNISRQLEAASKTASSSMLMFSDNIDKVSKDFLVEQRQMAEKFRDAGMSMTNSLQSAAMIYGSAEKIIFDKMNEATSDKFASVLAALNLGTQSMLNLEKEQQQKASQQNNQNNPTPKPPQDKSAWEVLMDKISSWFKQKDEASPLSSVNQKLDKLMEQKVKLEVEPIKIDMANLRNEKMSVNAFIKATKDQQSGLNGTV